MAPFFTSPPRAGFFVSGGNVGHLMNDLMIDRKQQQPPNFLTNMSLGSLKPLQPPFLRGL
jgi:hypothetical protein